MFSLGHIDKQSQHVTDTEFFNRSLQFTQISATHINGGVITFKHLGGMTYEIRMDGLRNCGGPSPTVPPPSFMVLYYIVPGVGFVDTIVVNFDTAYEINLVCPDSLATYNPCIPFSG